MAKRLFDVFFAIIVLVLTAPLLLAGAIGIWLSSPGPVLYKARRVGRNGVEFSMLKMRSMHLGSNSGSQITSPGDSRIFAFGELLRRSKIDELPQCWNILTGELSVVGPRAESPGIVDAHYTDWMKETLKVRPGLSSPGAIYNYMMADILLDRENPEDSYVCRMLTPKLALERAYVENAGLFRDMTYIALTVAAIVASLLGRKVLPVLDSDIALARRWAPDGPYAQGRQG